MASLPPGLAAALTALRARRGFEVARYCDAKAVLLNAYFARHGLAGTVVGVSGGIDSAVVLALVRYASRLPGSPIRRVVGVLAPMFATAGATNQSTTVERGKRVIAACDAETALVDLSAGLVTMQGAVESGFGAAGSSWAVGQLVSYLRTPAFYYVVTLLTDRGCPAALIGTTNRDEGAYIGFFGKASDGMVDLQLISDAHKSEVIAAARHLGVPEEVIAATPTGDTFDGRTDEEMIGVSYDGIELGALVRCSGAPPAPDADLDALMTTLDARHAKNRHKYLGASPAVHLDVYERGVPGGWPRAVRREPPPLETSFTLEAPALQPAHVKLASIADFGESAFVARGLLSASECDSLRAAMHGTQLTFTDAHGKPTAVASNGSERATCFDTQLADGVWQRLEAIIPRLRFTDSHTPTDTDEHPVWRAVGINPYFRFMSYRQGGHLVRHYDSAFDYGDGRRTLMSVVVSLTPGKGTRLLLEPQRYLPTRMRNFDDADQPALERDVLIELDTEVGDALLFDHRVPHDVPPWNGEGDRVVLRTDVIFEACGLFEPPAPVPQPTADASLAPDAAWRLARDPFYGALPSAKSADEAGYFDDGRARTQRDDPRLDPRWLTTPLYKLDKRLAKAPTGKLAVLVSTGAFYPVHRGHLEMMELARQTLEQGGVAVLAGYLSPAHDAYIRLKCGEGVPGVEHRIRLCEQAVQSSDWLMVDPWEACHTSVAVNFTEVVNRLERYIATHVRTQRPIDVVYVFGADNARFAKAFANRGRAICVGRPGFEDRLTGIATSERIIVANGVAPEAASSTVRAGDDRQLTDDVRAVWSEWRKPPAEGPRRGIVYLRDEGDWAVEPWLARAPNAGEAMRRFRLELVKLMRQAFRETRLPDVGADIAIDVLDLAEQRRRVVDLTAGSRTLSLDPCIEGDANLRVSRCFELALQRSRRGMVARPGSPPLEQQLAAIAPGSYVLVDDDRATGETLAEVQRILPVHCRIERIVTLCAVEADGNGVADLMDSRDFLAGARDGGLVVTLPNGVSARLPYLLPYVRPADRCSVPPSSELVFSRAVWQLNLDFFAALAQPLAVADAAPPFRALCDLVGLSADTSMTEVCHWHLERLGQ